MGLKLGPAPVGYLNEKRTAKKCQFIIDTEKETNLRKERATE